MFTGIVECMGKVVSKTPRLGGYDFVIESPLGPELKIDQSLCHDGICMTVVEILGIQHRVQAIAETVAKTNIANWEAGTSLNLERCMKADGRFDGHIVQGHVDATGEAIQIIDEGGQLLITIRYPNGVGETVEKGSVCVNGISLTVVNSRDNEFSVALIPYTREHTNLGSLRTGMQVNLEFDIIGKYLKKFAART
jgi:riboflavin synthase